MTVKCTECWQLRGCPTEDPLSRAGPTPKLKLHLSTSFPPKPPTSAPDQRLQPTNVYPAIQLIAHHWSYGIATMATRTAVNMRGLAAFKIRPAVQLPQQLGASRVQTRAKSGPYGYTQAKALVYTKTGEPSDVLK